MTSQISIKDEIINMSLLRKIYREAMNSIIDAQKTHDLLVEAVGGVTLTPLNCSQLFENVGSVLQPFSNTTHHELHDLSIREQINMLIEKTLDEEDFDSCLFEHEDLLCLMIFLILSDYQDAEQVSFETERATLRCTEPPELVRAQTLLLTLKWFKGAHRGKGYPSARWVRLVAQDLGCSFIDPPQMVQKGLSQGHKVVLDVERFAQDLRDIKSHASPLHFVGRKILNFEVICTDGRYRPFRLMARIQKSNFESLLLGYQEECVILNKTCSVFGKAHMDDWNLTNIQHAMYKDLVSRLAQELKSLTEEGRTPKRPRAPSGDTQMTESSPPPLMSQQ